MVRAGGSYVQAPCYLTTLTVDEQMLDCCRPLTAVASVGISLPEFACLARCNGLSAKVTSPSLIAIGAAADECIEAFRADLRAAAKGKGALALSYSRKTLGQTGDGHFSPIGGFCEEEDMVSFVRIWATVPSGPLKLTPYFRRRCSCSVSLSDHDPLFWILIRPSADSNFLFSQTWLASSTPRTGFRPL